jgi:hypothetical protein
MTEIAQMVQILERIRAHLAVLEASLARIEAALNRNPDFVDVPTLLHQQRNLQTPKDLP